MSNPHPIKPLKYNKEVLTRTQEYLAYCEDQNNEQLPTVEGLALHLHVDTDTLVEWNKTYPEFSILFKQLKEMQKQVLVTRGVFAKGVNPAMLIFLLKNNHGMSDQNKIDVTSGGKPIPIMPINVPTNDGN